VSLERTVKLKSTRRFIASWKPLALREEISRDSLDYNLANCQGYPSTFSHFQF
jgi:hypothetical protein